MHGLAAMYSMAVPSFVVTGRLHDSELSSRLDAVSGVVEYYQLVPRKPNIKSNPIKGTISPSASCNDGGARPGELRPVAAVWSRHPCRFPPLGYCPDKNTRL